jgi:acetoin:2,6-dichlorophenolindophenol oxidoreductase subunit alpha
VEDPSARDLYRVMALIRRFEERAIDLVRSGEIASGIHPCIGQEAVAAGLGAALRSDDVLYSNHRAHGHLLAKGSDPGALLAELAGRVNGIDRGRGGSFHPSDFSVGVYGCTGSVGHGAPMAVGTAWAMARQGTDRIAVSTFGDGAMGQGALLEALNLAALWRAPVVFLCENNGYATTMPVGRAIAGSVTARALACGIPAASHDGMDAEVVYAAAAEAVERARAGGGPVFLEFLTYRYEGHHTFELKAGLRYRSRAEVDGWRGRDPLVLQASRVEEEERSKIDAWVESAVEDAVQFALAGERPSPDTALDYLYSVEPRPSRPDPLSAGTSGAGTFSAVR